MLFLSALEGFDCLKARAIVLHIDQASQGGPQKNPYTVKPVSHDEISASTSTSNLLYVCERQYCACANLMLTSSCEPGLIRLLKHLLLVYIAEYPNLLNITFSVE